jgi:hypothetical protein
LETDINVGEWKWIKRESKERKLRRTAREGARRKERRGEKNEMEFTVEKITRDLVKKNISETRTLGGKGIPKDIPLI